MTLASAHYNVAFRLSQFVSVGKLAVVIVAGWLLLVTGRATLAQTTIRPIHDDDFQRLHALIKPQENESPWRHIDWLTNVTEARERAIAEDKPIIIFTAADGSPLGRT